MSLEEGWIKFSMLERSPLNSFSDSFKVRRLTKFPKSSLNGPTILHAVMSSSIKLTNFEYEVLGQFKIPNKVIRKIITP